MAAGRELFKLFGLLGMKGVEKSVKELKGVEKQAKRVQREMDKMGKGAVNIGKKMAKAFTAPLLIAAATVTKVSADFDGALTKSLAIVGGLSKEMREEMAATAIEVSKVSQFSAKAAAEAYFFLASAGLSAAQQMEALPRVAAFASAGNFDLARATDLLTDAQSALGLSSKDTATSMLNMTRVSDVLVKANTIANSSVEQFSEALTNKAGAALRVLGKGIEEGVAVLAVYADQGLKAAGAGESLNIVMRDLQRAALKNEKAFEDAKVSVFDNAGEMRNMADIVEDLDGLLLSMSDKQKRATLTALGFTDKSINATVALLGTSSAIRGYEKDLLSAAGVTDRVSEEQLKTFWKRLGLLKNRVTALVLSSRALSSVGDKVLIPTLTRLVEAVEGAFKWFGSLDRSTKKTIAGFAAIVFAAGPVAFTIGKIILGLKVLIPLLVSAKLGTLGFSAAVAKLQKSALGMTIVIGSLVAVGWYYYSQWETISSQFLVVWNRMKLAVLNATNFIIGAIAAQIDFALKAFDKLTSFIPGLSAKINGARAGILRWRASLLKLSIAQTQHTAALRENADSTSGFVEGVKKSVKALKDKLGVTKADTEATKEKAQIDLDAAAAARTAADEEAKRIEKSIADKAAFDARTYEQLDKSTLTERELLDKERGEQLQKAEELGADVFAVKQLYSLKAIELEKQEALEKQRTAKKGLATAASFGSKINGVLNKFSEAKLARIDNEEKRKIKAIESSQMTEEEKEKAIQGVQADAQKKREVVQKKQARREKLFSLFSIAVNTAAAVVKALPNIPLSIAVGLLGAASFAATAAKPLPFFDGGLIEGSDNGITAQMGERNQDEVVFPLQRGIDLMVKGITSALSVPGAFGSAPPMEAFTGASIKETAPEINLHIGTFIGDERGLRTLERKLQGIRNSEDQRRGVV